MGVNAAPDADAAGEPAAALAVAEAGEEVATSLPDDVLHPARAPIAALIAAAPAAMRAMLAARPVCRRPVACCWPIGPPPGPRRLL